MLLSHPWCHRSLMIAAEPQEDFCAICREPKLACDYITRCGHSFHSRCLWPSKNRSETTKDCPMCRQNISNFIEKEKLFWNIKKEKLDKAKSDEIISFLNTIMEFSYSSEYLRDYYYGDRTEKRIVPAYGRELLENLKKIGWNINSKVDGGILVLKQVCERDDLYRFNLLIDFGLNLASGSESAKEASSTISNFNSILVRERLKCEQSNSMSQKLESVVISNDGGDQLIEACKCNNFEKVKALISKGVDVNSRNSRGTRPLHKACSWAHIQIVEYLIENGAEINCTDLRGISPLHEACTSKYDRKDVVKRLLELKAKVDYLDQDKNTQLHVAIISRKYEIAEMLVDHYDNVNLLNIFNESPLHLAADFAPKSLIDKLITHGADLNTRDSEARLPLHRAVTNNTVEVVDVLLSKGAEANKFDKQKNTPVLLAIKRTDPLPFVTSLVKYGADLNFKDVSGKTALEISLSVNK